MVTCQADHWLTRVSILLLYSSDGLIEPPVVPRFLDALAAAGAAAVRVPAYLTTLGLPGPDHCRREAELLQQGYFDAVAFSSTAEVCQLAADTDVLCNVSRLSAATAHQVHMHGSRLQSKATHWCRCSACVTVGSEHYRYLIHQPMQSCHRTEHHLVFCCWCYQCCRLRGCAYSWVAEQQSLQQCNSIALSWQRMGLIQQQGLGMCWVCLYLWCQRTSAVLMGWWQHWQRHWEHNKQCHCEYLKLLEL